MKKLSALMPGLGKFRQTIANRIHNYLYRSFGGQIDYDPMREFEINSAPQITDNKISGQSTFDKFAHLERYLCPCCYGYSDPNCEFNRKVNAWQQNH